MTQTKCSASAAPVTMVEFLRGRASNRKRRLFAIALLILVPLLGSCQAKTPEEASIVLSMRTAGPRITNGQAYDKAVLDIGDYKGVIVPDDAKVEHGAPAGQMEINMKKSLHWMGHLGPGVFRHIRDERKRMGCASKTEADKLVIATWGEWDSLIEGGASMKMLIRVPAGLRVETRKGLSGPARGPPRSAPTKLRDEIKPGENGWKAVSDEPDPKQTAKSVGSP